MAKKLTKKQIGMFPDTMYINNDEDTFEGTPFFTANVDINNVNVPDGGEIQVGVYTLAKIVTIKRQTVIVE